MKPLFAIILNLLLLNAFAQETPLVGKFATKNESKVLDLYADGTFHIKNDRWEFHAYNFYNGYTEEGRWKRIGDTIVLNPQLPFKPYTESKLSYYEDKEDTTRTLIIKHVIREIDAMGKVLKSDTFLVRYAKYKFNSKKNKRIRVAGYYPHCAFAGPAPDAIVGSDGIIKTVEPVGVLKQISIGCYPLGETKTFNIDNPQANKLALTIYSNHYTDGMLRNKKVLVLKDDKLEYKKYKGGKYFRSMYGKDSPIMRRVEDLEVQ